MDAFENTFETSLHVYYILEMQRAIVLTVFLQPRRQFSTWMRQATLLLLRWPPVFDVSENRGKCVCENY